jgi:hypothetical protein
MEPNHETNPIEVYDGNLMQISIVKSLLENADIEAFVKDEYMGTLKPWVTAGGGAGAIKIFVAKADEEKARQVIADYEKNSQISDPEFNEE